MYVLKQILTQLKQIQHHQDYAPTLHTEVQRLDGSYLSYLKSNHKNLIKRM